MNPENEKNENQPVIPQTNSSEPPKTEENPYALKWGVEENTGTASTVEETKEVVLNTTQPPVVNPTSTASPEVVPIAPAFEVPASGENPPEEKVVPTTEVQPDPKEEKRKNRNLILLGIFFVVLLLFVYFLPDITAFIAEKKSEENDTPVASESPSPSPSVQPSASPVVKNGKLICTSIPLISADQALTTTVVTQLNYTDEKVQEVVLTEIHDYKTKDLHYNQTVQSCDAEIIRYNDRPGYHAECNIQENQIKIVKTFSLKTFQTITDLENNVVISSSVPFNADLKEMRTTLESSGNTCK